MNTGQPRHWHITRDIKPKGECPACDRYYWAAEEAKARGVIISDR